jgi:hypothetical protein
MAGRNRILAVTLIATVIDATPILIDETVILSRNNEIVI